MPGWHQRVWGHRPSPRRGHAPRPSTAPKTRRKFGPQPAIFPTDMRGLSARRGDVGRAWPPRIPTTNSRMLSRRCVCRQRVRGRTEAPAAEWADHPAVYGSVYNEGRLGCRVVGQVRRPAMRHRASSPSAPRNASGGVVARAWTRRHDSQGTLHSGQLAVDDELAVQLRQLLERSAKAGSAA
jgi:hypothetical protein